MLTKPKLYVLDDDSLHADLLVDIATNAGWQAEAELSAKAFLDLDLNQNGILILDLIMPEMDGIEVIRTLAEKNFHWPLILVSGFDSRVLHSAKQLAEAHNINVLASLTKPLSIKDFLKILGDVEENIQQKTKPPIQQPVTIDELKQAIKEHQLVLYFQPQIDIKTSQLHGVEALVRWQHPQRGLIFPDQFIQLAEENDLIDMLTEEIIALAVEQSQSWQQQNIHIAMSVNISARNITSLKLPEQLLTLTQRHAISPEMCTLEITETAVMSELTSSLDVLNRLRMKGFSLSIDDFGTGYSSLTQLYQAPFSELKIDQRFVMHMFQDKEAMVIVKICIMLGHMLGMRVVGEGVETQAIWDQLSELGCDIAQGYLIAKPMPAQQLIEWNHSGNNVMITNTP